MTTKLSQIEPYRSLAFSETAASPAEVVMTVPLAGNRNDKGSMFGGSIYSAMVLANMAFDTTMASPITVRQMNSRPMNVAIDRYLKTIISVHSSLNHLKVRKA